jgi:hypothetical protein
VCCIRSSLRELDIHERYSRFFRNQYRRLLRLVGQMRASQLLVKENLEMFADDAAVASPNSWEHIFYTAVVDDAVLIDFLENAELPHFL